MRPLLDIAGLQVSFSTWHGEVEALKGISLQIDQGETLALVGESGSGKSVTATAVLGLLDRTAWVPGGEIVFEGRDLLRIPAGELRRMRGSAMSMIFQNPRSALNPIRPVLAQIADALIVHFKLSRAQANLRALDLLRSVAFRDPVRVGAAYPHELSGGMCQRALIALAIACKPRLLVADEPTTGLDVTTQKQIMDLLADLIRENGMSMLLITHDLGLAANYADRIAVMFRGEILETGQAGTIGSAATNAYTKRLVAASPTRYSRVQDLLAEDLLAEDLQAKDLSEDDSAAAYAIPVRMDARIAAGAQERPPLLAVSKLCKRFGSLDAVKDVSFSIEPGSSLGLVGESGSGKSTISRLICRLIEPDQGEILLNGRVVTGTGREAERELRKQVQFVFQDPIGSINPRFSAARAIADPLIRLAGITKRAELDAKIGEVAALVGLDHALLSRLPHQLSGGQAARVGVARAIATDPRLLVLDEPTAALDVSIQAIVLNLLEKLRSETGMSFLFVSHDLNVVRMMCERMIVLREGRIVDELASADLFSGANHDYTNALAATILEPPSRRLHSDGMSVVQPSPSILSPGSR